MMRWILVLVMSFALAACDSTKTTDMRIDRSPKDVYTALSQSSVGELGTLLPDLKVVRTSPGDLEILYTFPKSADAKEAKVHFVLEPLNGGKATNVSATIDVPAVRTKVKGETKVLSATKIANELRKVLNHYAIKGDPASVQRELSELLGGIALATNSKLAQKAFDGTLAKEAMGNMNEALGADLAAALAEADMEEQGDSGDWGNTGSGASEDSAENAWGDGKFEDPVQPEVEQFDIDEAAQDAAAAELASTSAEDPRDRDWAR